MGFLRRRRIELLKNSIVQINETASIDCFYKTETDGQSYVELAFF